MCSFRRNSGVERHLVASMALLDVGLQDKMTSAIASRMAATRCRPGSASALRCATA